MIQTKILQNGVRVVFERVSNLQKVSFCCRVMAGSQNEIREQNGIAHYLEHCLFLGTSSRTEEEIQLIERHSGTIFNAETGQEYIQLTTDVLPEDFALVFDVYADMIQNPTFPPDKLEREKGIVLTEISEFLDDNDNCANNLMFNAAYKRNPLGLPIEGTLKTVKNITRDDLISYYQKWFRPENLIISVAGNTDFDTVVRYCEQAYGQFTNNTPVPTKTPSPYLGGDRREEQDTETNTVRMAFQGVPIHHFRDYMCASLYAGVLSLMAFDELRIKQGLLYGIQAENCAFEDSAVFYLSFSAELPKQETIIKETCRLLRQTVTDIPSFYIEAAKKQMKLDMPSNDGSLDEKISSNLFDMTYFNHVTPPEDVLSELDSITPAEIQQIAGRILNSRLAFAVLGNTRKTPTYDQINKWLNGNEQKTATGPVLMPQPSIQR